MRDIHDAKAMAHTLRAVLTAMGLEIKVSQSLELIAQAFGATDWNTLSAAIRPGSALVLEPCCSFCGKAKREVRSLCEGGCSREHRGPGKCVFICDECVTFCAQINADLLPAGSSMKAG